MQMNEEAESWSISKSAIIYGLSALCAFLLFPGTDPLCGLRYVLFGAVSVAFWVRVAVGQLRKERGNADKLWFALVISAPLLIFVVGLFGTI